MGYAARDYVRDIGPKGLKSWSLSDGTQFPQLLKRYGDGGGHLTLRISFNKDSAVDILL